MLRLPADLQSHVAQNIDGSESKITRCMEEMKVKTEELSVEQRKTCELVRQGLEGLDKAGSGQAQELHDLSLDVKNSLQALTQAHNSSTDVVLERITNNAIKLQNSQQTELQALSNSTKESAGVMLRSVLQQETRNRDQSIHIHRKLEQISNVLESVGRIRTEERNQSRSQHTSRSDITAKARAFSASLRVMWKSLDDVIQQFM